MSTGSHRVGTALVTGPWWRRTVARCASERLAPIRALLMMLFATFVSELIISLALYWDSRPIQEHLVEYLVHSSELMLAVFPVVYLFVYRPLRRQIVERTRVEVALQRAYGELEGLVAERTADLAQANGELMTEIDRRRGAEESLRQGFDHLRGALEGTIGALAMTVELRDPYTAGHQRRVAELSTLIARDLGLTDERVEAVRLAAIIHDIGKIAVPSEILSKPGRLRPAEFSLVREHPQVAYDILKAIDLPWSIATIVAQHHERLDGSGYPDGLTEESILVESRIIAVADVVEAMASHRPYRARIGMEGALAEIARGSGSVYDPDVVRTCIRLVRELAINWE